PELKPIAVLARVGGGSLDPAAGDLDVTAGWGHAGQEGVTMPGRGRLVGNNAPAHVPGTSEVPGTSYDVYLNDVAYWRNVPARVWDYTIGGYQVIKKWLSYRERALLGRGLTIEEAQEVTHMARRIAALMLLEPALDANYAAVVGATYAWAGERAR
ncbi:MAG: DNA methyltransferase, partial [Chloroflexi bacterium]|nr:DNA methyltransferase [Chloroflexota bacterium]